MDRPTPIRPEHKLTDEDVQLTSYLVGPAAFVVAVFLCCLTFAMNAQCQRLHLERLMEMQMKNGTVYPTPWPQPSPEPEKKGAPRDGEEAET